MRRLFLLSACAALMGWASWAAAAAHAEPFHPVLDPITGVNIGPKGEQFKGACGVAVDSHGDVYVADYHGNRIVIFNSEAELLTKIEKVDLPPSGTNPIDGPCDLAVDSQGHLYVNNWHRNVTKFTPAEFPPKGSTKYTRTAVIDSSHPTSVAVDPKTDQVYVDARTYVAVYEPSGAPVLSGGEPLRIGMGSLGSAYGIALAEPIADEKLLYVADAADETVKVYELLVDPLVPIRTIDGAGTPLGTFHLADSDLAVDPEDQHLYVTNNLEPGFEHPQLAVEEFSEKGFYRGRLPKVIEGESTGEVNGIPSSVAIAPDRRIYVTSGNHEHAKVLVFGPAAELATEFLSIEKLGVGAGTVTSGPAGIRCGAACKGEFDRGPRVTLTATPAPHNRFVGWTGCEPTLFPNECSVRMLSEVTAMAEFEPIPQRSLAVAKTGSGTGTVVSSPPGLSCGSVCEAEFDEASAVMLTATAADGARFAGWSGCDAEPGPDRCQVTMSAARSVTAEFESLPDLPPPIRPAPAKRTLAISLAGVGAATGTVSSEPAGIDCGGVCATTYDDGTVITLVARPAPGARFLGWGSCDDANGTRCTLKLGSDKTVVAAFGPGSPGPLRMRRLQVHGARAVLRLDVPGPGELSASGRMLHPITAFPLAAGPLAVRLQLTGAGLRALRNSARHRLSIRLGLTFEPFDGGDAVGAKRTIVFSRTNSRVIP